MNWLKKLTASHVIGFRIVAIAAMVVAAWAMFQDYGWKLWAVAFFMYFVYGCFGIVMGYHRLLTHRSYQVAKPVEYILTVLGALGGTGSSIAWVGMHQAHHRFSDTDRDPHSPHNGLWKMIALDYAIQAVKTTSLVGRLMRDPVHRFIHVYYNAILAAWIGLLWLLGGEKAALFVGIIPIAITAFNSNFSNWLSHKVGYKTYDTHDDSRNHWFAALLTFGEGWHNNHHRFPSSPRLGLKWWEFDIAWQFIKLIRRKA